jgi:hypothetical protein
MNRTSSRLLLLAIVAMFAIVPAFAQSLNWDGQTGALVTPFAYVTSSPANGLGAPTLGFHMINGGDVLGIQNQASVNIGAFKRLEFGYSRTLALSGNDGGLFSQGFNTFQAKVNLLPENSFKTNLPAISVGFVAHARVNRVADYLTNDKSNVGDIYVVGTKTITNVPHFPIVVSGGVKGSNDVLNGLAGAAANWTARGFGAAAFVVNTPFKSKTTFGAEVAQEPSALKNLPGVVIPTTLTYFARIAPLPEKPINLDLAVGQFAGTVAPGLDLKARAQFAFGVSYRL